MSRNRKGDHFTKIIRRRMKVLATQGRQHDRLWMRSGNPAVALEYERAQLAWAKWHELAALLTEYELWKGFQK